MQPLQNQFLLHQFMSGFPGHISKQLRATWELTELNKILERAKQLMANLATITIGCLDELEIDKDDLDCYIDMEQFFMANDTPNSKKAALFLLATGARTC